MKITAEQWSLVSGLLDEAVELPGEQRAAWLESLDGLDDSLKAELRSFLERHARIESSDFLRSLPALGGLRKRWGCQFRWRPGWPSGPIPSNGKSAVAAWAQCGWRSVPMGC